MRKKTEKTYRYLVKRENVCTFAVKILMTMEQTLLIYNTLHRKKERFEPIHSPNVGMYV